jgi:hypothetical protein
MPKLLHSNEIHPSNMPEAQPSIIVRPAHGPDIRPLSELIAPFVELFRG